jgi:hypothetical protein
MNADIEADGLVFIVMSQVAYLNREELMKINTNVKSGGVIVTERQHKPF